MYSLIDNDNEEKKKKGVNKNVVSDVLFNKKLIR